MAVEPLNPKTKRQEGYNPETCPKSPSVTALLRASVTHVGVVEFGVVKLVGVGISVVGSLFKLYCCWSSLS